MRDEFFYWTVVDFGMKPTIRVNHVVIHPLAERSSTGIAYAIATKQLYASHYFHTTLELRFLADRIDRTGRAASTLISVTRSRSDGMTGFRGVVPAADHPAPLAGCRAPLPGARQTAGRAARLRGRPEPGRHRGVGALKP